MLSLDEDQYLVYGLLSLDKDTREGQKVLATIFFLFTWVHLFKGGSVYIKYEPLSFIPCNMNSVALGCTTALA